MNYEEFRMLWHEALREARLLSYHFQPEESIDVTHLARTYSAYVSLSRARQKQLFSTAAQLSWKWDAILAARSVTSEEDVLRELLGDDESDVDTELPWLRVDVVLHAATPWESPLPMPDARTWRHWAAEVRERMEHLLPVETEDRYPREWVLSSLDDPTAEIVCKPNGQLAVERVKLAAWQAIILPRQWNDSGRETDPWPEEELADFAGRVRQALEEWEDCLQYLC